MADRLTHRWTEQLLGLTDAVDEALAGLVANDAIDRMWEADHTVWTDLGLTGEPAASPPPNRLGWLSNLREMREETSLWRSFADEVRADGFERVVVLSDGVNARALRALLASADLREGAEALTVDVVDVASSDRLDEVIEAGDIHRLLVVVSVADRLPIATLRMLAELRDRQPSDAAYVVVADDGGEVAKLLDGADYRRVVLSSDDIALGFGALSPHTLLVATLAGIDVRVLLDAAGETAGMLQATGGPAANLGLRLGVYLAAALRTGRDLLTLVTEPELDELAEWVAGLVTTALGPCGLVTVATEQSAEHLASGERRVFVGLNTGAGLNAVVGAGHPAVALEVSGAGAFGSQLLLWQFAVGVAAAVLEHDPFAAGDERHVEAAALLRLSSAPDDVDEHTLDAVVDALGPGEMIRLVVHAGADDPQRAEIAAARLRLRDRVGVAVSLDFGPLEHHRLAADNALIVQVVPDFDAEAVETTAQLSLNRVGLAIADAEYECVTHTNQRVMRVGLAELLTA
jgi:hypothetical protein